MSTKKKSKKSKMPFVVYVGPAINPDEILVCLKKDEKKLIKEYFADPSDRNLEEYDREEVSGFCVRLDLRSSVRVWT